MKGARWTNNAEQTLRGNHWCLRRISFHLLLNLVSDLPSQWKRTLMSASSPAAPLSLLIWSRRPVSFFFFFSVSHSYRLTGFLIRVTGALEANVELPSTAPFRARSKSCWKPWPESITRGRRDVDRYRSCRRCSRRLTSLSRPPPSTLNSVGIETCGPE